MARTASLYRMINQFGGLQAHQTLPRERNPRSAGEAQPLLPCSLQPKTTQLHGCDPYIAPVPFSPPAFLARQRNQRVESKWAKLRASLLLIASSFFSPAQKMVNRTPIGRGYRLWKLFRAIMEQGR